MIKLHNLPGKYLFYCDENFPESSAHFLRSKKFNVILGKQVNKNGIADDKQLRFAASSRRILLTSDFDFEAESFIKICKKLPTGVVLLHSSNPLDTNKLLKKLIKEITKKDIQLFHKITIVSFSGIRQICE